MSNIYWIVAHYDERLGTNWTGIDEDRCVAEMKSFDWGDTSYPPWRLYDWVERTNLQYLYPLLVVDHDDNNRFVQFVRDPRSRESWYLDRNHDAIIKRWQTMLVSYGTLNAQAMPCTWQCLPPDGYPREGRAWAQYNGDLTMFEAKGGLMLGAPSVPSVPNGHGVSYQPVNTGTLVASESPLEALTSILTDEALADRLEQLADKLRNFKPEERNVFLREAAKRLRR